MKDLDDITRSVTVALADAVADVVYREVMEVYPLYSDLYDIYLVAGNIADAASGSVRAAAASLIFRDALDGAVRRAVAAAIEASTSQKRQERKEL